MSLNEFDAGTAIEPFLATQPKIKIFSQKCCRNTVASKLLFEFTGEFKSDIEFYRTEPT